MMLCDTKLSEVGLFECKLLEVSFLLFPKSIKTSCLLRNFPEGLYIALNEKSVTKLKTLFNFMFPYLNYIDVTTWLSKGTDEEYEVYPRYIMIPMERTYHRAIVPVLYEYNVAVGWP